MNCGVPKRRQAEPTPTERVQMAERAGRLQQAIQELGTSVGALARAANLNTETVHDALNGIRRTDSRTWRKLGAVLRHQHLWLQHGMGERRMSEEEAVAELSELKLQSQTKLAPVSSAGVERWLTHWGELLSVTPEERDWLHKFQWLDPSQQYGDMVYKSVLDAYRMMKAKPTQREDSPAPG
jgi:hypothetical protein